MVLDRAIADEGELRDYVASFCSGRIVDVSIEEIDFVKDSTTVRVQIKEKAPHTRVSESWHDRRGSGMVGCPCPPLLRL